MASAASSSRGRHPYRPVLSPQSGPTISILPTTGSQLSKHHSKVRSTELNLAGFGVGWASINGSPVMAAARRRKLWTFALLAVLAVSFLMYAQADQAASLSQDIDSPAADEDPSDNAPRELSYDTANPFATRYSLPRVLRRRNEPLMQDLMLRLRGGEAVVREAFESSLGGVGNGAGAREKRAPHRFGKNEDFSWLKDRTILLVGDSIDRYHLLHFCQFLQPEAPLHPAPWPDAQPRDFVTVYTPDQPGFPPRLADLEKELAAAHRNGNPYGSEPSRVWTCDVDRRWGGLNAVLVWGFLNGLDDGVTTPGVVPYPPPADQGLGSNGLVGEPTWPAAKEMPFGDRAFWPVESPHFNPPLRSEDRYEQLFAPILKHLGREKVDMVELGVGPWDLGMFRSQDTLSVERSPLTQETNSTYIDTLAAGLSSQPLSAPRLAWFSRRFTALHTYLTDRFPARVRVRGMHLTPQWYSYPWVFEETRIRQVQRATRAVAGDEPLRGGLAGWESVIEGGKEFLDHIHPAPIPGSWVWADMMLNDLKRLVQQKQNKKPSWWGSH